MTWSQAFVDWLNADRDIALIGVAVTVLGTGVAIQQIRKVRRATLASRLASLRTMNSIRAIDLTRLVQASADLRRRVHQTPTSDLKVLAQVLKEWLEVSPRVAALIDASADLSDITKSAASDVISSVEGQIIAILPLLDRKYTLASPNRDHLEKALLEYDTVMSGVALILEDAEVARHG